MMTHHGQAAEFGCPHQRRLAELISRVGRSARIKEQLCQRQMTLARGDMERRGALGARAAVPIRPSAHQMPCTRQPCCGSAHVQRRATARNVQARAERSHAGAVTRFRRGVFRILRVCAHIPLSLVEIGHIHRSPVPGQRFTGAQVTSISLQMG